MAKIAVLLAADMSILGVASTKAEVTALKGDRKDDEIVEVTAKTFTPSEQYASFKEMCMTPEEREAAQAEAKRKADEKAAKEKEKADKKAQREADIAAAGANKVKRSSPSDLTGEYHLVKPLPPCADNHAKKPIWNAIANNTDVEAAKKACPEVNPPRATSGVYTFTSEFRYFLKTGYVAMGAKPEAAESGDSSEAEAGAEA